MIDATLSPDTRMQLIIQKLHEANALKSSIPNSQGQMVGGRYIAPIADMVKGFTNRFDANALTDEAMDAFKLLDSERSGAKKAFAEMYSGIDPENKPALFKAAIAAASDPLLEDDQLGKLFTTLLKPQTSLFGTPAISEGRQITKGLSPTSTEIPGVTELVDAERKARLDNIESDNRFKEAEAARRAAEHTKTMELRQAELNYQHDLDAQRRQDALAKEDDAKVSKFIKDSDDVAKVHNTAAQVRALLEKYADDEKVPGFDTWARMKVAFGGAGLSPEELDTRAAFNALNQAYTSLTTGAAATLPQVKEFKTIIGDTNFADPAQARKVLPRLLKFIDDMNRHYRSEIGDSITAQKLLEARDTPLRHFLLPEEHVPHDATGNPELPQQELQEMERHSTDDLKEQQDAIARKLGVDPDKIRKVVKVK